MRSSSALRRCLRCAPSFDSASQHQAAVSTSFASQRRGLCFQSDSHFLKPWFAYFHELLFANRDFVGDGRTQNNSLLATSFAAGIAVLTGALSLAEPTSNDSSQNDKVGSEENEPGTLPKGAKLDTEGVVQYVRRGVEERLQPLKDEGLQIPHLTIAANGQQVAIRFPISRKCDISRVIEEVVEQLGEKVADSGSGTDSGMVVRAWDSPVVRHVIISPAQQSLSDKDGEQTLEKEGDKESNRHFCVLVFEPLVGDKPPEIEFLKTGYFTSKELDAIANLLNTAGRADSVLDKKQSSVQTKGTREAQLDGLSEGPKDSFRDSFGDNWPGDRWRYRGGGGISEVPRDRLSPLPHRSVRGHLKALETLENMGVKVYGLENLDGTKKSDSEQIQWDNIAGYHDQKRDIEDTVLLALLRPDVYDRIARGTRRKFESNRPRAILFEGPPGNMLHRLGRKESQREVVSLQDFYTAEMTGIASGTGKTSCARVIASQAKVPLLYVPVEILVSKYYGESERLLASLFTAGNELPDGAIVFLDEIDSLATARDSEMHEATRRMLSVLLRQLDGFEQDSRIVVIAATNRKQDLDPALLSRFDSSVTFNLPDLNTRAEIAAQYARHLSPSELASLAAASEGMSGRDLHDVCQQAERRWASKLIRGVVASSPAHGLPPIDEYIECANKRRQTIVPFAQDNGFYRAGKKPWSPAVPILEKM